MLNDQMFSQFLRNDLWTEAANTAMLLENNSLKKSRDLSTFLQFLGRDIEVSCCRRENLEKYVS